MGTTYTRKPPQPVQYDVEDRDDLYVTRMPSSARRYKPSDTIENPLVQSTALVQRRRSNAPAQNTNSIPATLVVIPTTDELPDLPKPHNKHFPLMALLIGMLGTILLLLCFNMAQTWWQGFQDDLHYGNPRTVQFDAVVGHNDSDANPTHFILTNLHGRIEIIEIPGGDTAHTRAFNGPTLFGSGQDRIPPKGEIRNDHGQRNLVIRIGDNQIVFINDGTTFHL